MALSVFLSSRLRGPREFLARHERRISALAFVLGFLWDSVTLTRVDRLFDNLVLASYLLIAFASILMIHAHRSGRIAGELARRGAGVFRFLLPFAFGGLLSGLLIFYSRSGSVVASAPFIIVLSLLFIGNEFLKRHYERLIFQMAVFFAALLSYSALIVPVFLRRIGDGVFALSGLGALLVFFLVLKILRRVAPVEYGESRKILFPIIGMIYVAFNFFYFSNLIPPVPLSLKEIGVYHSVSRTPAGAYLLRYEKAPWFYFWRATSSTFHETEGEGAYVFSAVYAPAALSTEIAHRWLYLDEETGEWITAHIVRFPLSGGRAGGFRGYSLKERLTPGRWRVNVETFRGQIIGRVSFRVERAASAPSVVSAER